MYDFAAVRQHTHALWVEIQKALCAIGVDAPAQLDIPGDACALWQNPDLVLTQTCGYPYVSALRGHTTLIGTPDYGVVPDRPGWYFSVVICRQDDPRKHLGDFAGARFALNETGSQSGCRAMMHALATGVGPARHLGPCVQTGSHQRSALAVARDEADIAAIDVVTWHHLLRDHPELASLRVLQETDPTPGLPYISAKSQNGTLLATAVESAIRNLSQTSKDALYLKGFWHSHDTDYTLITAHAAASQDVFKAHFGV